MKELTEILFWQQLNLVHVVVGGTCVLIAVALGAFLVVQCKREETTFSTGPDSAIAIVMTFVGMFCILAPITKTYSLASRQAKAILTPGVEVVSARKSEKSIYVRFGIPEEEITVKLPGGEKKTVAVEEQEVPEIRLDVLKKILAGESVAIGLGREEMLKKLAVAELKQTELKSENDYE